MQCKAAFWSKMRWETRGNVAMGIFDAGAESRVDSFAKDAFRFWRWGFVCRLRAACSLPKATGLIYRHYVIH